MLLKYEVLLVCCVLAVCHSEPCPSVCVGKGTLTQRFTKNMYYNDIDGNGFVSGPEVYRDFKYFYDTNQDGCVNMKEIKEAWVKNFNFDPETAKARFEVIIGNMGEDPYSECPIKYEEKFKGREDIQLPMRDFIERNVAAIVSLCEKNPFNVYFNCDCYQLDDFCLVNTFAKTTAACKQYLENKKMMMWFRD